MGGQLPVEGSAAAQMADVMAELQSLPRNGQLQTVGAAGIPPLHKSFSGSAEQAQPLQVRETQDSMGGGCLSGRMMRRRRDACCSSSAWCTHRSS